MEKFIYIYALLFTIIGCNAQNTLNKKESKLSSNFISANFTGKFTKYIETEETTSGTGSITYNFIINKDKINLTTTTYQEPIMCNGKYKGVEKSNILEIYYDGDEKKCISKKPSFFVKKEKNKYFIKGVGGEGSIGVWLELKKE